MLRDLEAAKDDRNVERKSDGVYVCGPDFSARICLDYGYSVEGLFYGTCDSWEQARDFASPALTPEKFHDVLLVTAVNEKYPGELGVYIGSKDRPSFSFSAIRVSGKEDE